MVRAGNRREWFWVIFVVLFTLHGLNRQKIMKDISAAVSKSYQDNYAYPASGTDADDCAHDHRTEDTAIVITSSWIPSHPSTYMLERVLNSTALLHGLSPTAPIVITVDHFRLSDITGEIGAEAKAAMLEKLEKYTENLFHLYAGNPRVHVVPAMKHLHIGGSVVKAMRLVKSIYPSVEYMYYLQHDFVFGGEGTDHAALVRAMKEHDEINYVRFLKRSASLQHSCGDKPAITYNSTHVPGANGTAVALTLTPTPSYSDNNHLVRLRWNMYTIASIVKLNRTPENPLQSRAVNGCHGRNRTDDIHGLYLYHKTNIWHLDGRHTASAPVTAR